MDIWEVPADAGTRRFETADSWTVLLPGMVEGAMRIQIHASGATVWSALHDHAVREARDAGASRMVSVVREDNPEADRLRKAGYTVGWRSWGAELILPENLGRTKSTERPGVTIRELAPGDAPTVYLAYARAIRDFPENPATTSDRYDEASFRALFEDSRVFGVISEAGRCLGLTVSRIDGEVVDTLFTFTDLDWRGQGLATALKETMIRILHAEGGRVFRTGGAEVNVPMLAVNSRLGYRLEPMWLTFVREMY